MNEAARTRAEESVSTRFTRLMNATTSRWGMLTDPSIVGAATAPPVIALIAAVRLEASPLVTTICEIVAATPITVAVLLAIVLRGARARVIAWLAGLPFPLENMNAVLNGLGETLEVTFRDAVPPTPELNAALEKVSEESFVSTSELPAGGPPALEVRIGVVDSKRNPAATNHQRFVRVRAIVEEVLIPLAERHPIVEVRVK
jgi:hypothetical protein